MRAAKFEVATELLQDALHMPPGSTITSVEVADDGRTVTVVATDPSLPEADEPHTTTPMLTAHRSDDGSQARVSWDWGVK